ncbi:hypothetical protein MAPG_00677 [Magnaporthiopsis poae ATCC 64411]|uniref:Uncharacterized protein n=1 Tax=Magnaporthiopsis poae (strain ATCC 64411 / 73-15) TaxID=644358 RepID=A0A0C4DLN3_MAGP6|nr:hypothetical protein MAPG_00677 [Magnaporthiopsis poae ATCC 64411]
MEAGPLPTDTAVGHRVSTNHGGCSITVLDSRGFSSQVASWQHTLTHVAGGRQCLTAPASPAPAVPRRCAAAATAASLPGASHRPGPGPGLTDPPWSWFCLSFGFGFLLLLAARPRPSAADAWVLIACHGYNQPSPAVFPALMCFPATSVGLPRARTGP